MIVPKQFFELSSFTTAGGAVIRQVRVGWESYGALNKTKDNAILVTHFFSANSPATGRYRPEDAEPGYWDAIIGPGKAPCGRSSGPAPTRTGSSAWSRRSAGPRRTPS